MKALSVRQPYASLICYGVKTVENRTWKTDYRGRMLIHASGKHLSFYANEIPDSFLDKWYDWMEADCPSGAPESYENMYRMSDDIHEFYGITPDDSDPAKTINNEANRKKYFFRAASIIGEVELVDIIRDSRDEFALSNNYHWILKNPILYENPIKNVMGRLRLWDFDIV